MTKRCSLSLEEQYVFWKCALGDMKEARSFIRCVVRQELRPARCGLFTATVVAYMRPFTKSRIGPKRQFWLDPQEVGFTDSELNVHRRYEKIRDKTFAHTDLEAIRASVEVSKPRPGSSRVTVASAYVGRDPSRSNRIELHGNINRVIEYVDQKLSDLHERFAA